MSITHPSFGTLDDNRVIIFDTTLRDGEQSPGFSMNLTEKIRMAEAHLGALVDGHRTEKRMRGSFLLVLQSLGRATQVLERRRRIVRIDEVIELFRRPIERGLEVTSLLQSRQLVLAGIGLVRAISR